MTFAYLDPGAGSLIASVLVGGAAAAGVAAKQARAKLGGFGRKKKDTEPAADGEATPDEATAAAGSAPVDEPAGADAPAAQPADEPTTVRSDT